MRVCCWGGPRASLMLRPPHPQPHAAPQRPRPHRPCSTQAAATEAARSLAAPAAPPAQARGRGGHPHQTALHLRRRGRPGCPRLSTQGCFAREQSAPPPRRRLHLRVGVGEEEARVPSAAPCPLRAPTLASPPQAGRRGLPLLPLPRSPQLVRGLLVTQLVRILWGSLPPPHHPTLGP